MLAYRLVLLYLSDYSNLAVKNSIGLVAYNSVMTYKILTKQVFIRLKYPRAWVYGFVCIYAEPKETNPTPADPGIIRQNSHSLSV